MIFSYFKHQKFASIFLLLALLFVTVSHSHEYSPDISVAEQLDCKLCQQFFELPKTHIVPTEGTFGYFSSEKVRLARRSTSTGKYCNGSPRAPPLST